jgi:hypothetical protein
MPIVTIEHATYTEHMIDRAYQGLFRMRVYFFMFLRPVNFSCIIPMKLLSSKRDLIYISKRIGKPS